VDLFLVDWAGEDEPSISVETEALGGARLQAGWSLMRAGVVPTPDKPRVWLLAKATSPAGTNTT
jgi:hypothetical protein